MTEYTETRNASEFIVGTLLVSGVVRSEDADLAHKIVEEELRVWLSIKEFNKLWPFEASVSSHVS
jgi:hypothetical protein